MRYNQIRECDIANGEGIGVALFVQGCHFKCKNCFNSETWDFNGGKEWTPEVKEKFLELVDRPYINRVSILGGEPLANENVHDVLNLVSEINGRYNTPQHIVCKDTTDHNILHEKDNQIYILLSDKKIWIYSGFTFEQIMYPVVTSDWNPERDEIIQERKNILSKCDVLVDGRFEEDKKDLSLRFRGSSNQRLIDLKETFRKGEIVLWK
ncbi:MAG: 4Fe-4S single cluster domain-containing protein [Lachnospiraceae bacterium]|nr:4Fe-4S single cluster domain-containing protein [Lachnospiraceae bacterium]